MTQINITTDKTRYQLWMAAIKWPMYSVAVIPIWMGTAIAMNQTGKIDLLRFLTFLISAILIIAWLNISNDVFDAETGIDINKAHSVVNLTGNKTLMFWIGNLFLVLGISGIVLISWLQQDFMVIGLILLSCFLGYTYQGPPFRLGYQGLGEIICFICFGPLAVSAAYYSQTASWSWINLAASVIIGITTSIILFCSHFHQVADDLAAGKKSPIVRMGTKTGFKVLRILTISVYVIIGLLVGFRIFPVLTLLVLLSLPLAQKLITHVGQYHDQPEQVSNSKFIAVSLHFWSGIGLGLGFLW